MAIVGSEISSQLVTKHLSWYSDLLGWQMSDRHCSVILRAPSNVLDAGREKRKPKVETK
jgi:hypothetical protein